MFAKFCVPSTSRLQKAKANKYCKQGWKKERKKGRESEKGRKNEKGRERKKKKNKMKTTTKNKLHTQKMMPLAS